MNATAAAEAGVPQGGLVPQGELQTLRVRVTELQRAAQASQSRSQRLDGELALEKREVIRLRAEHRGRARALEREKAERAELARALAEEKAAAARALAEAHAEAADMQAENAALSDQLASHEAAAAERLAEQHAAHLREHAVFVATAKEELALKDAKLRDCVKVFDQCELAARRERDAANANLFAVAAQMQAQAAARMVGTGLETT